MCPPPMEMPAYTPTSNPGVYVPRKKKPQEHRVTAPNKSSGNGTRSGSRRKKKDRCSLTNLCPVQTPWTLRASGYHAAQNAAWPRMLLDASHEPGLRLRTDAQFGDTIVFSFADFWMPFRIQ